MLIRNRILAEGPLLCFLAVSGSATVGVARAQAPAPATAARPACPAPPTLALLPGFEDPRGAFGPNSRAFRSVEKRFSEAYRTACRNGAMRVPLMRPGALDAGHLFLKNAPSANIVAIYRDGDEGATGPMVMEYPFIGDDGRSHRPSVAELRRAIVCSVYYANPPSGPVGDLLECLPD